MPPRVALGLSANIAAATELLAPLTSAADLPTHPSMSIPYKSSILSDMVQHASEMLHRERKSLWNMKRLLTKLRGDETWIPCGDLNSEVDNIIFDIGPIYKEIVESELLQHPTPAKGPSLVNGEAVAQSHNRTGDMNNSGPMLFSVSTAGTRRNSNERTYETAAKNIRLGLSSGPQSETIASAPANATVENRRDPGLVDHKEMNVEIKEELLPTADKLLDASSLSGKTIVDISQSLDSGNRPAPVAAQSINLNIHQEQSGVPDSVEDQPQPHQQETLAVDSAAKLSTNGEEVNMADDGIDPKDATAASEGSAGADDNGDASQAAPHRMQTRAQAQAKSENTASSRTRSASPVPWTPPVVHPLFLMPGSAYPDRNFGLPPGEAEETRRMVTLYAQKQEEVCRSAEKLYVGLLRADRMRKTVFKWCKAEGHVGEMSDGEDWYDKEEWGLDEDLRKGQEEEEEDKDKDKEGAGTQAKKTRKTRVSTLK